MVAHLGEACPGDQADIAGADHSDFHEKTILQEK